MEVLQTYSYYATVIYDGNVSHNVTDIMLSPGHMNCHRNYVTVIGIGNVTDIVLSPGHMNCLYVTVSMLQP